MQSKHMSLIEALVNIGIGCLMAWPRGIEPAIDVLKTHFPNH